MRLKYAGKIEFGDECRVSDELDGAVRIGGVDLVWHIGEQQWKNNKVTIGVADQTFSGTLFVECGWGYSEWTPMDSDELKVGDHDLLETLRSKFNEGDEIVLFASDEPGNILDDSEWCTVTAERDNGEEKHEA